MEKDGILPYEEMQFVRREIFQGRSFSNALKKMPTLQRIFFQDLKFLPSFITN